MTSLSGSTVASAQPRPGGTSGGSASPCAPPFEQLPSPRAGGSPLALAAKDASAPPRQAPGLRGGSRHRPHMSGRIGRSCALCSGSGASTPRAAQGILVGPQQNAAAGAPP
eukprot:scaffold8624_cov30-Tisochrysis_lutea.AAC.2